MLSSVQSKKEAGFFFFLARGGEGVGGEETVGGEGKRQNPRMDEMKDDN